MYVLVLHQVRKHHGNSFVPIPNGTVFLIKTAHATDSVRNNNPFQKQNFICERRTRVDERPVGY